MQRSTSGSLAHLSPGYSARCSTATVATRFRSHKHGRCRAGSDVHAGVRKNALRGRARFWLATLAPISRGRMLRRYDHLGIVGAAVMSMAFPRSAFTLVLHPRGALRRKETMAALTSPGKRHSARKQDHGVRSCWGLAVGHQIRRLSAASTTSDVATSGCAYQADVHANGPGHGQSATLSISHCNDLNRGDVTAIEGKLPCARGSPDRSLDVILVHVRMEHLWRPTRPHALPPAGAAGRRAGHHVPSGE